MRWSATGVYCVTWRTLTQGTIVDHGRIFLYLPRLDGTGPRWSRCPQLWVDDGSRAPVQDKVGQGASDAATPHHLLVVPHRAVERCWNALPGVSQTAKHWSTWYGQSTMDFFCQGPHRNLRASSLTTKWLGTWPLKFSEACRYAVWWGHLPSLTSHPEPRCNQSSLHHPLARLQEKTEAMEMASPKVENTEEGGCRRRAMCRSRQTSNGLDAQSSMLLWWQNDQLLAITSPADGWGKDCDMVPCMPLAINMALVLHHTPHILPSGPNQYGDQTMAASGPGGPRGKQGRSVDRGLHLLLTMCGGSINWMFLGDRGWGNGPTGQPSGAGIPVCHRKACKPIHSTGLLATKTWYCTKAADEGTLSPHNPMPGWSCHAKPFEYRVGYLRVARYLQELLERRLSPLLSRFNGRPQLKNAGDPVSVTWRGRKVSGGGASVKIWRTHAGLWSANEWHRVGSDEGGPLIAHRGGIAICEQLGKLLSQPICSTSKPKGHPITPGGVSSGVQTDGGPITKSHGNRLG